MNHQRARFSPHIHTHFDAIAERLEEERAPVEQLSAALPHFVALMSEASRLGLFTIQPGSENYTRAPLYVHRSERFSLYGIAWAPGQWTPVHDHGTWGLVGVVQGQIHELNYHRHPSAEGDERIHLSPSGVTVLSPNAINSFLDEPDHIHKTGVPSDGAPAWSLHLYGRHMSSYFSYDVERGTRALLEVEAGTPE